MDSEWVRLIVSVLSGLAATIPLAIQPGEVCAENDPGQKLAGSC